MSKSAKQNTREERLVDDFLVKNGFGVGAAKNAVVNNLSLT